MDQEARFTPPVQNGNGMGYLIIRVTTARGAIPLEGAEVNVYDYLSEFTPDRGNLITSRITDQSGKTPPIALSAPKKEQSLSPQSGGLPPYSAYTVDVRLDGYTAQQYINVPIFDGITAIQQADLIPLTENERPDSRSPDGERFFESESPDL